MNTATWHCAPCVQWRCARSGLVAIVGLVALCAEIRLDEWLPDARHRVVLWSGLVILAVGERIGLLDRWASLGEADFATVEQDRALRPKLLLADCVLAAGASAWGLVRLQACAWDARLWFMGAAMLLITGALRWSLTAPVRAEVSHGR